MNSRETRTEEEREVEHGWQHLMYQLKPQFKRKPTLESMIFLIGIQELGFGPKEFTKEEKQDVMHVAICILLEPLGMFEFIDKDADGWPHYYPVQENKSIGLEEQEFVLKRQILRYFEERNKKR